MIISRTPFRISFFGGGTDYPGWFRQHGGEVLATTIDKYCYLSCRYLPPFFEHKYRIVYSRMENAATLEEIGHPAVRAIIRYLDLDRGLEIHHDADLPARSGMGSSSAFTVGLLHALYALKGQMPGRHRLAMEGIHVEQDLLQEHVGSQDQVLAAYGGFNHVLFSPTDEVTVRPITLSRERIAELNDQLMLFYTGIKRTASDVAGTFVAELEARRRQLQIMKEMVAEGLAILSGGQELRGFGALLDEAWGAKRHLSAAVSNGTVDELYACAKRAGALGGKLLGAGGGGFLLLFVPVEAQAAVRRALDRLIHVPFRFEHGGSQIVFCDREAEYVEAERERDRLPIASFQELSLTGATA
jgi:D-glycero-alpha-D-manno-heptose-7-phosphate kinase